MSTPVWKKRLILIVGLIEVLVFSGTIFGWTGLVYMLKSEGVYQYICDDLNREVQDKKFGFNDTEIGKKSILKRNTNEKNLDFLIRPDKLDKRLIDLMLNESVNASNQAFIEQLEAYQIEPMFSPKYTPKERQGCGGQDRLLNLAYTIGSFCMGFSAFVWGFLLERWGLKIVRLLISCLITGGAILLCVTNADRPFLIFPAITLLSLGGVPLRIANMQFANLCPSKRSTIISLYSGAFCASAVVFVALKYLFDAGLSYFVVTLILAIASLLMFPFTLFVLPSDRIREDSDDKQSNEKSETKFMKNKYRSSLSIISPVTLERFSVLTTPTLIRKIGDSDKDKDTIKANDTFNDLNAKSIINNNNNNKNPIFLPKSQPTVANNTTSKSIPLKISLWSWAFNLHQWWFSWLITYMIIYAGSLNQWLQRVTTDVESASNFSKIYGCAQVLCLVLAPIAGLIMDHSVQKADKETDPFERKLKRVKACFWPIFITTLFLSACLFCRFFDNKTAVYVSIVFMTIFRSFLVAVGTSYLRIRFSGDHFNRLLGIMSTVASVVSLLQFPLFIWEAHNSNSAFWVNIFNCLCTIIAFTNPIHILITPLQRYLLVKEEQEEAEAKAK